MVKAIEENADVPVVHMLTPEEEYKLRYGLVTRALKALQTPVTEQTVFAAD